MLNITIDNLLECFEEAFEKKAKYIGIAVTVPNEEGLEVIINPSENFKTKLKYYCEAYNPDLTHKTAPLRIVGIAHGDRFGIIEQKLVG